MNDTHNPNAFPKDNAFGTSGMSLLDYFAGQAMGAHYLQNPDREFSGMDAEQLAARAYTIADAMIAERAKRLDNR